MKTMTHNAIQCSVCQHMFFSQLIDPIERNRELITKLTQHYNFRHKEDLVRITNDSKGIATLLATYIFLHNLAIIPTDNLALVEAEQEIQDQIMKLLGFDVETEDNEEDETEEIDTTALAEFDQLIEGVDTKTQLLLKQWVTKYLMLEDESEVTTPETETTEV